MTVEEFLIKKNKIFYDLTGAVLVPDDQIIDVEKEFGDIELSTGRDDLACPYCHIYEDDCRSCIMKEKGNKCEENKNSTYGYITSKLGYLSGNRDLIKLVKEFNDSRKDKEYRC